MRDKFFVFVIGTLMAVGPARAQTDSSSASAVPMVETVVCIRHGERTDTELGQMKIQGFNRALALPKLLLSRYGKPDYLFAPNPSEEIGNPPHCYVRPLAAIEPTAIYCDLPVNTLFGFRHIKELQAEIEKPLYKNSVIFICWEHHQLEKFVQQVVADHGGNPAQVPDWKTNDYDSLYVLKLSRVDGRPVVTFTLEKENLNNLSDKYPGPAPTLPPGH
jgi:hypothetical protein